MLRFRIRRDKTDVKLEYMITRRGQSRDHDAELQGADENPSVVSASMNPLIEPDALIPTDGKIKELAVEVTGSQSGTVTKPRPPTTTSSRICARGRKTLHRIFAKVALAL